MKKAVIAILPILLTATSAMADTFSPAYIQQLDGGRAASMTTSEILGAAASVSTGLAALRPATGNLGYSWQSGLFNDALIVQSGSGNVGLIQQVGAYNTASIQQVGTGHAAMISQQGRGNVAIIRQR